MKVDLSANSVILAVSLSHVLTAALPVGNEERLDPKGIDDISDTFKTVVKVSEAAGSSSGAVPSSSSKPIEKLRKSFESALRISKPPPKKKKADSKKQLRLKSRPLSKLKGPLKSVRSKKSKLKATSRAKPGRKPEETKPRKQLMFTSGTWAQDVKGAFGGLPFTPRSPGGSFKKRDAKTDAPSVVV